MITYSSTDEREGNLKLSVFMYASKSIDHLCHSHLVNVTSLCCASQLRKNGISLRRNTVESLIEMSNGSEIVPADSTVK